MGLPVVTTHWKELELFQPPVKTSKDYNDFCNNIINAIYEKNKSSELIDFVKDYKWNVLIKRFFDDFI